MQPRDRRSEATASSGWRAGSGAAGAKLERMEPKIGLGETLGEVFQLYRQHAGVLLPIAFWLFLAVAVIDGIAGDDLGLGLLVVVASAAVGTLYQGVVVGLVRDVQDGRRDSSIGELVRAALPFVVPLFGAGLLAAIGIAVGLLALIVPGLFLLTIWAVIAPAIVIERRGVFDAFRRSRELVRGHGWEVFGVVVVAFLIAIATALILAGLAEALADGPLLAIVFSALASTVTAPIEALVAAVLYYRLLPLQRPAAVDQHAVAERDV